MLMSKRKSGTVPISFGLCKKTCLYLFMKRHLFASILTSRYLFRDGCEQAQISAKGSTLRPPWILEVPRRPFLGSGLEIVYKYNKY